MKETTIKKIICQECGQRINVTKKHNKNDCDYYKKYLGQDKEHSDKMGRVSDKLWELYNQYSTIKGVLIISSADFKKEVERIEIQLNLKEEEK